MSYKEEHDDKFMDMLLDESIGQHVVPDLRHKVYTRINLPAQPIAPRAYLPRKVLDQKPSYQWLAIAASIVALLGFTSWFYLNTKHQEAMPMLANGSSLSNNQPITAGSKPIEIKYRDGSQIVLESKGVLEYIEPRFGDSQKLLKLKQGELRAEFKKQPKGKPVRILTHAAEITVIGTKFTLIAEENKSRLVVESGIVEFKTKSNKSLHVRANEFAEYTLTKELLSGTIPIITSISLIDANTTRPVPGYENMMHSKKTLVLSKTATKDFNILVRMKPDHIAELSYKIEHKDLSR